MHDKLCEWYTRKKRYKQNNAGRSKNGGFDDPSGCHEEQDQNVLRELTHVKAIIIYPLKQKK